MDMVSWVKQAASVSLALAILSVDAWSQEVQPEVSMCQAAMQQLYLAIANCATSTRASNRQINLSIRYTRSSSVLIEHADSGQARL